MRTVVLVAATLALLSAAPGRAAAPIGVITELHVANGRVEVKPAAGGDWQPAMPLLSINEGDQVRASGAGRVVLVFMATQRSAVVTPANSPYVAALPPQPGLGDRLRAAVAFLQSTPRDRVPLTVRSAPRAVTLLAPRETLVAAESVRLEWTGPDAMRYTVRLLSADGRVLVEKKDVAARTLALSPDDVRLRPGPYRWEVEDRDQRIERAVFDVAMPDVAAQARAAASVVEQARYPEVTAALLKAAALMGERFHADARRELLRAIAASPEEPTLHMVLADVYRKTGLKELAAGEQQRADDLSVGR
jgi:hypothetical protein